MTGFVEAEALAVALADRPEPIVAIDGWDGAGKSTLAREVATRTGRKHIDLDDLLLRRQADAYVEHIDLKGLASAVASGGQLVLSGICLRQILEAAGITLPCVHVYVRELNYGLWGAQSESNGPDPEGQRFDARFPPSAVRVEIRNYHAAWRPHLRADFIYDRETSPDWARRLHP